jgi:peptidoglycan/LPS O-acetylase OafA/YrhL
MQFDLLGLGIATAIIERKGHFVGIRATGLRRLGAGSAVFFCLYLTQSYRPFTGFGGLFATLGPLSLGITTAACVLTLWQRPACLASRVLALRPFAYFGQISYGLYLFHPNCIGWSSQYFGSQNLTNACIGLSVTLAAASLSWHVFEKPINGLKNRFGYTEKGRATGAVSEPTSATTLALPESQQGRAEAL